MNGIGLSASVSTYLFGSLLLVSSVPHHNIGTLPPKPGHNSIKTAILPYKAIQHIMLLSEEQCL
jgi:hypothetical protein